VAACDEGVGAGMGNICWRHCLHPKGGGWRCGLGVRAQPANTAARTCFGKRQLHRCLPPMHCFPAAHQMHPYTPVAFHFLSFHFPPDHRPVPLSKLTLEHRLLSSTMRLVPRNPSCSTRTAAATASASLKSLWPWPGVTAGLERAGECTATRKASRTGSYFEGGRYCALNKTMHSRHTPTQSVKALHTCCSRA
jgi:hypothetical protein